MNVELQRKLFEKYPKIFGDKDKGIMESCMCWGICGPDSWYDLIDNMCGILQWNTDKNKYPQVVADQVKEKFGTLRFYYHLEGDKVGREDYKQGFIDGVNSTTENMTAKICAICGSNKNIESTKGWVSYQCEDCRKIRRNKMKEKCVKVECSKNSKSIVHIDYDKLQKPHGGIKFTTVSKRSPHVLFLGFNGEELEYVKINDFSQKVKDIIKDEIQINSIKEENATGN